MWIRYKNYGPINFDYVQSIYKYLSKNEEEERHYIKFYQLGDNYVIYYFETKKEIDEFYDALLKLINAEEVPLLKL